MAMKRNAPVRTAGGNARPTQARPDAMDIDAGDASRSTHGEGVTETGDRRSALRQIAATSHLRRQFGIYVLARLGSGMTLLALLLTAHAALHTYSRAGLVNATYGLGVAVGVPVFGRLADRHSERVALLLAALINASGTATVLLTGHLGLMLLGAALMGLGLPPTAPCLRASWRDLPAEQRTAIFALDGIVLEAAQLVGPVLVGFLAVGAPRAALLTSGCVIAVSALLAAATFSPRGARQGRREHWLGPLRVVQVDLLLVILALVTGAIALVEVAVVSFGTARGSSAESGILLGAMSAGSILGGLIVGSRAKSATWGQLIAGTGISAAGFALLPLAGDSFAAQLVLLAVSSLACAPLFTTALSLLGDVAPSQHTTETYAWISTANYLAIALGTATGGALLAHIHHTGNYLVAVAVLALAVLVALVAYVRRPELPAPTLPGHAVEAAALLEGGKSMSKEL